MELLKSSYGHFMDAEYETDDDSDGEDTGETRKSSNDSLECPFCFDVLDSAGLLRLHKRAHHELKRYTCKICETILVSFIGWQYHYRKHNKDLRYSCDSCKVKFCTFQQLVSHCGNHKFFCSECEQGFVWSKQLRKHEIEVHRNYNDDIDESKAYRCEKCAITFPGCTLWRRHLKENQQCRPFVCCECKSGFMTEMQLNSHIAYFINCRNSMEKFKRRKLNHNTIRPGREVVKRVDKAYSTSTTKSPESTYNYVCIKCDQTFTKMQARREHWIRNIECRPYGCSNCNARFVTKEDIEKHVRIHMFKCHCARSFLFKSDFEAHLCRSRNQTKEPVSPATAAIEAANKMFVCAYCDKTYYTEDELQSHIEFDSQFVYICSECHEVFRNQCTFGHHLMNSHDIKKNDISEDRV